MRGGPSFRRAVAASVGLHVLLAVVLLVAGRWHASRPEASRPQPGIETRVDLRIEFPRDEVSIPIEAPSVTPSTPADPPTPDPEPEPRGSGPPLADPPPEPSGGSGPPLVRMPTVPQTLPPELLALLKRPPAPSAGVVEVPVTPTPLHPRPAPDPTPAAVRTTGGSAAPQVQPGAARVEGGSPVHGPLGAGQVIVYVLDASGSMGEWGKFDAARRALVATIRKQPETVRFQVVVYEGFAFIPLPAAESGCVPATADHVGRMTDVIRALKDPRGRSNHAEGLRKALTLQPDFVLILTDADDLPAAALRGVMRQATRPVTVCVAKVGADGVGKPVEVR
ncbi:MAG: hypothetical protein JWO38_6371 [Gemmataceae bacterium]|nr:hypothetical protein [Gemmataceae bacterium]